MKGFMVKRPVPAAQRWIRSQRERSEAKRLVKGFMVGPQGLMVMEGESSWARRPPSMVAPRRGQHRLTVNCGRRASQG
jgi:hypothetical protein